MTDKNPESIFRQALNPALAGRTALLAVYSLALLLLNLDVLRALAVLSSNDASASHLVLIPLVTVGLVLRSRADIFRVVRSARTGGTLLIGVGLLSLIAARHTSPASVEPLTWFVASLVLLWTGGFLLFYGASAFRAALFPLLFLAFTIPIPGAVLDTLVRVLTTGSSEVVAWLFALTGTPFHREGFIFALPRLSIHIADECSGIRSTIALALTALLAGHVYLRSGWAKLLLVMAVFPITILKNGIRIVTLSLLSIHVDPSFLEGRLHHDGGVVFFLLALVLFAPMLALLRRSEARRPAAARAS